MLTRLVCVLMVCAALVSPALAQNRAKIERDFQTWLLQEIWPAARKAGVSRSTFDRSFRGVSLNWDLPDLVPPGSNRQAPRAQRQAEFGAPGRYFGRGAVNGASATGRQMAKRHSAVLAQVEKRTGVPGRIILAIWGRESAYGKAAIPHNAFQVLGTKAFMSRRAAFFRAELIAALQIAETGQAPNQSMKSSWAGALGQPQFMPSSFLKFAADGDGDGRADIWTSEADTIASIGAYLDQHGWDRRRDWGLRCGCPHPCPVRWKGRIRGVVSVTGKNWGSPGYLAAPFQTTNGAARPI